MMSSRSLLKFVASVAACLFMVGCEKKFNPADGAPQFSKPLSDANALRFIPQGHCHKHNSMSLVESPSRSPRCLVALNAAVWGAHSPRVSWSAPSPTTSLHFLLLLLESRKQSARAPTATRETEQHKSGPRGGLGAYAPRNQAALWAFLILFLLARRCWQGQTQLKFEVGTPRRGVRGRLGEPSLPAAEFCA